MTFRWTAMAVLLSMLASCASDPSEGYSFRSTFDDGVRTVAVPVFENTSLTPGLEAVLTDAVIKRVQSATPWAVTSLERADTTLRGVLTDTRLTTLSSRRDVGLVEEQGRTITVDFTWEDNRTGEVRVARRQFSAASTFVPARGVQGEPGERIEIADRAAIDELAAAIVGELRNSW